MSASHISRPRFTDAVSSIFPAVVLFAVNAYVCANLFAIEYTQHMESAESVYIGLSQFAMDHWGHLTWCPLWFDGMPFFHLYQPGLPAVTAFLARTLHWSAARAYHVLTAFSYCLAPVTLYVLCCRFTRSRGYAFATGLVYSLFPLASLISPAIRSDVGGWLLPRRLQVLSHYGEGPHLTALMLVPLVILGLDLAARQRRWQFLPAACVLVSAVVLTNWTGTVGMAIAILAWILASVDATPAIHWPTLVAIPVVSYALICPWIPPSIIKSFLVNAPLTDASIAPHSRVLVATGLAVALVVLWIILRRARSGVWLRFAVFFCSISACVALGREWWGVQLVPQSNRLEIELGIALAIAVVYSAKLLMDRVPATPRTGILMVCAIFAIFQLRTYRQYGNRELQPVQIEQTIEYKMAHAFEQVSGAHRVFAPGSVSFWLDIFTGVPQMAGCCDQSVPTREQRIAFFTIYSGMNAGARDAEISLDWLKAYGADAIGVTGPHSTEYWKPFADPKKFDGVLRELWREDDNVIYQVPRQSREFAHVISRDDLVTRAPVNGLKVDQLARYNVALDGAKAADASMTQIDDDTARIDARMSPDDVVSVQISYDPGLTAWVDGRRVPVSPDALGMTVIDARCAGHCEILLRYDGEPGHVVLLVVAMSALVLLGGWTFLAGRRTGYGIEKFTASLRALGR